MRNLTMMDRWVTHFDHNLRALLGQLQAKRPSPAADQPEHFLTNRERKHACALMRINHSGEICAQALYQGQSLAARTQVVRENMQKSAEEELDHLAWCETRLTELGCHTSYLNPLWHFGSFMLGAIAGVAGDKWSLGFVAETERQVSAHLTTHLQYLPIHDEKSRSIVIQMRADEMAHATRAIENGAAELPEMIKNLMRLTAKIMTTTAYWI